MCKGTDPKDNLYILFQSHSLPYIPTTSSVSPLPAVSENGDVGHNKDEDHEKRADKAIKVNARPVQYDNPWDFVPDQPNVNNTSNTSSNISANSKVQVSNNGNCDSSSGISSSSGHSNGNAIIQKPVNGVFSVAGVGGVDDDEWFSNTHHHGFDAGSGSAAGKEEFWSLSESGILDDPFDAEWAALAARKEPSSTTSSTNPFNAHPVDTSNAEQTSNGSMPNVKAFELQM